MLTAIKFFWRSTVVYFPYILYIMNARTRARVYNLRHCDSIVIYELNIIFVSKTAINHIMDSTVAEKLFSR